MVRPIRFNNNSKDKTSTGESLFLSSIFRAFQILSDTFRYSQIFSSRSAEQIRIEMLTCESTTPRCNLHLEEKPTVGKLACKILTATMNKELDERAVLHPQNGRFLKLGSLCNLAERRLEPIFDNSKPHESHSVHRDRSRNKYLWQWHCIVYTSCKPQKIIRCMCGDGRERRLSTGSSCAKSKR